ncbi:MAG: MFS transporter [Actinomycetia bacterium]|nr:MFS transporter [Actinomycetes bacterium]
MTLLLLTVVLAFTGQMLLNPVIAPLSRAMGMQEWQIGATISLAAVALMLCSPLWGKASQRLGVKRVLVISLLVATSSLTVFALVAALGMRGAMTGAVLVVAVVVTRGLVYGSSIAAVTPTAQAYLVTRSSTEAQRIKVVGAVGAAQGLSAVTGAVLGGALAGAGGLLLPLIGMPVLMGAGLIVLAARFRPQGADELIEQPQRVSVLDPRIRPFLAVGFLTYLVFSSIQTLFGFLIQDRFHLSATATASVTAAYMVAVAVTMILAQAVVVPRLKWGATSLVRRGLLLVLVSTGCLWLSSYVTFAVACVLLGLGMGLLAPGYNAGPTLELSAQEQGSLAGLINATNGAAYALAPIGSTALYGLSHGAPIILAGCLVGATCVLTMVHPRLRSAPHRSRAEDS